LEKFEKRILRGKSKNCPRAPEKKRKKFAEKIGNFFGGNEKRRNEICIREKKKCRVFFEFLFTRRSSDGAFLRGS